MSIVSNEHQYGSPFPPSQPQERLPKAQHHGRFTASPGRFPESGEVYWDLIGESSWHSTAKRLYGTLPDMAIGDIREVLRALDKAYSEGAEDAKREIRRALGVGDPK